MDKKAKFQQSMRIFSVISIKTLFLFLTWQMIPRSLKWSFCQETVTGYDHTVKFANRGKNGHSQKQQNRSGGHQAGGGTIFSWTLSTSTGVSTLLMPCHTLFPSPPFSQRSESVVNCGTTLPPRPLWSKKGPSSSSWVDFQLKKKISCPFGSDFLLLLRRT